MIYTEILHKRSEKNIENIVNYFWRSLWHVLMMNNELEKGHNLGSHDHFMRREAWYFKTDHPNSSVLFLIRRYNITWERAVKYFVWPASHWYYTPPWIANRQRSCWCGYGVTNQEFLNIPKNLARLRNYLLLN